MNTIVNSGNPFDDSEFVIYGSVGVCKLLGVEQKCFDGTNSSDYYKICPIQSENSNYYIPVNQATEKFKHLLTKEEIHTLLEEIPTMTFDWKTDSRERKHYLDDVLKSQDHKQIILMIKAIQEHQIKMKSLGKKLVNADENALKNAENTVYREFSIVLDMTFTEVEKLIAEIK